MTNPSPRIPPLATEDWNDEIDSALSVLSTHAPGSEARKLTPETRPKSNILGIYAWHPELMRGWMPYSNHLRNSTLGDRIREIVIIRTTWLGKGEYEWAQHVRMSRAAGWLTDEELAALEVGAGGEAWSEADRVLLQAIDELCIDKNLSDETWSALESNFDRRQILDLLFTVGTYDFHCTVFRAIGLQLEPGMEPFPPSHR